MQKKYIFYSGIYLYLLFISLSFISCGDNDIEDVNSNFTSEQKEFVYVPEYILLSSEQDTGYVDVQIAGNSLYYEAQHYDVATRKQENKLMLCSLVTNEAVELPLKISEGHKISSFEADSSGNVYTVEYSLEGTSTAGMTTVGNYFLCKYDSQGNVIFEKDITQTMESDDNNSVVKAIVVDEQGRIYMASDTLLRLFDAEGDFQATVLPDDGRIEEIGCGKDGKVYISYYDMNSQTEFLTLREIDFEGKKFGESYANFPAGFSTNGLCAGVEADFLINDGSKVYGYDLETQTSKELFAWSDSDIYGSYVVYVGALENGKLLALLSDPYTYKAEITYLTKTDASNLPVKQEVTIGTLYEDAELERAVVDFNKYSETYRIEVKTYMNENSDNEEALTELYNDILSDSDCPDILSLTSLNVEQLAANTVFEDLNPYLEKSNVINKEDFFENIINGYTLGGKLICIPGSFELSTIAAKTSDVGTKMGWSLDEIILYAEKNSEVSLFDGYTKEEAASMLMTYVQNVFVDWEAGTCRFDSDEFKKLLTFVNSFPDENALETDESSTPVKLQAGDVLLMPLNIYNLRCMQDVVMFKAPVTFIGYPNEDGNSGCYLTGREMYAITSKSDNKDGAWAFIEDYLTSISDISFQTKLSANKQYLEAMIAQQTKIEYILDENGQPLLDENGAPIPQDGGSTIIYDDWEYTYHIPTLYEAEQLKKLIDEAVPVIPSDYEITNIINEEAPAYYLGQKSVDDVAEIIQSRVQLYVNENR